MRYLLTFSCYGHRLHGQHPGTVDRRHNAYGAPMAPPSRARLSYVRRTMKHPRFHLDARGRSAVLESLHAACRKPGWTIWAAHVRSTHVHVVIEAECPPEKLLCQLKAAATAHLQNLADPSGATRLHPWSRHGSTRYLWTDDQFRAAMAYVIEEQGPPLALFVHPAWQVTAVHATEP
ncbi:MAG: hypothetical protein KatS3mg005_1839 [Bryobacteraceae bacterium]|nr:MAG: hypothetical protein KatS3mg005_1839 [Bryobacteraceae bacterium]